MIAVGRMLLFVAATVVTAFASCLPCYPTGHPHGWWHLWWLGGGLIWLFFVILVTVVVYLVWRGTRPRTGNAPPGETPLDILKKRYAKGEITAEEFGKMKKDLESTSRELSRDTDESGSVSSL